MYFYYILLSLQNLIKKCIFNGNAQILYHNIFDKVNMSVLIFFNMNSTEFDQKVLTAMHKLYILYHNIFDKVNMSVLIFFNMNSTNFMLSDCVGIDKMK